MPPQLPWPGHACSARRARTSGSGSAAYWNAVDEVDGLAGHRIDPGVDRAVGEHQRGDVVLEQGGQRADGRLVARDDGDDAGHVVGLEVRLRAVVDELAARQRVPHPVGAVELAVGDAEGERRRDETNGEVVVVDPLRQRLVHRVDLRPHAEVALAVAERADDAPHGVVHLGDVLAEEASGPDALDVASGISRHELAGHVSSCEAAYPRWCRRPLRERTADERARDDRRRLPHLHVEREAPHLARGAPRRVLHPGTRRHVARDRSTGTRSGSTAPTASGRRVAKSRRRRSPRSSPSGDAVFAGTDDARVLRLAPSRARSSRSPGFDTVAGRD